MRRTIQVFAGDKLIHRFDRIDGQRIMYISAATMLGVDTTTQSEHAYTEIVDAIPDLLT